MRIVGTICGADTPSIVKVKEGSIASVRPADGSERGPDVLGGPELILAPALLDIHVHGSRGRSVTGDGTTPGHVAAFVADLHRAGVGLCCPAVVTGSFETMSGSLRAIDRACADPATARSVVGIPLEGPYLSGEDGPRGAQPPEHVRKPDWNEFLRLQEAAGNRIRLVTLAPELEGAIPFIEKLAANGVVPAIGHTAADGDCIRAAIRAGARHSTHIGNGAHALIPRHPNYIWEQLAADELYASIIADGHHLPPSVVRCIVRCKGPERTILISDAVRYAGLEPGSHNFAGQEVEVTGDGKIMLKGTPYLAGSALEMHRAVANVVRFSGVELAASVRMATLNPARLLGIDDRFGTIEVGKDATVVLFRWDDARKNIEVKATVVGGELVYRAG